MYENVWMNVAQELEQLPPEQQDNARIYFRNNWENRNWMNTPGTIYCADTDNCGTGMLEATANVRYCADSYEVIYRQPLDHSELIQVISAAKCETFGGYGADGDLHWNRELLRDWWANRDRLKAEIALLKETDGSMEAHQYDEWLLYLDGDALLYLRVYAFFLENQRAPRKKETLPEL